MVDLRKICDEIVTAVRETEMFIIEESHKFDRNRTEVKGLHDLVSYVDKGSEEMLVEKLSAILPEAGFIAEEGTSTKIGKRYCWVIDPLDGTTNFVHNLHPYAISVSLMEDMEPVACAICNVGGDELFTAWQGGGAWLNHKHVEVSKVHRLSESLIATGFPYNDFSRMGEYIECFNHFCRNTHGIRRLGSASIDMAYVACGIFEGFYEYGLKIWDIAAGILLVREAGGHACDFSGNEKRLTGYEIVAANDLVFPEFLENVSKFMVK